MAKSEKRNRERIASSSYFLGCFGFSRKIYSGKPMIAAEDGGEKKRKKKIRLSFWSKFRLKKGEIKPAPVEEIEKLKRDGKDEIDKQKPASVIGCLTDRKNIPVNDKPGKTKETKTEDILDINDRSKHMETLRSSREDTCQEGVSNSTRDQKPDPMVKTGTQVDPVIGISIMIMTLMIMLIWGRLCAILCTSAFCYFLPRIRDAAAIAKRKRDGLRRDLDSRYKKQVTMDGLLKRQNRVSL